MNAIVFFASMTLLTAVTGQVHAQVYKCKDASGKTVYSDHACGEGRQEVSNLRGNSLDTSTPRQRRQCPSEQDIADLERKVGQNYKKAEIEFFAGELRRARACQKEGGNYTAEDLEKIKAAQQAQDYTNAKDRRAARAIAESIHAPSASNRENTRINADKQAQATRAAGQAAADAANRQIICNRVGSQTICN